MNSNIDKNKNRNININMNMNMNMNLNILQEDLIDIIKTNASLCIEYQQLSKRLKDLIELKYEKIKESYESIEEEFGSKARLSRKAFLEKEYIDILERYLTIKNEYIKSKVIYDTYMMLFEARRTQESYLKAIKTRISKL